MTPRSKEAKMMEDPEQEQGAVSNSKRPSPSQEDTKERRTKRTRRGVFDESGLTDQERRNLRRSLRQLHETIRQDKRENLGGTTATATTANSDNNNDNDSVTDEQVDFLQQARQQNNILFENVLYTREAVLDAENVDLIAQKYVQQVERLVQVRWYWFLYLLTVCCVVWMCGCGCVVF